jgi:tRNA-2-methylthio-N6-dimethylallyladenosine synthase
VDRLREKVPNIALSTDVIIGFPSETDEEFEDTMDILNAVRFDMVYSFLYSPRVGTVAAKMEDAVSRDVKNERMSRLLALQDKVSLEKNLPYEGKCVRVLTDSSEIRCGETVYTGRTDTNKLVHFKGADTKIGEWTFVEIEKACPYDLIGKRKD